MPRRLSLVAYKTPLTPAKNELLTRATSARLSRSLGVFASLWVANPLSGGYYRLRGWAKARCRITYRTRGQLEGYGKSHSGTSCAARPLTPSPRAGRLFAAWRATGKTEDATRFRRVGIPSRNVRLGRHGMEWNRPQNRCRHLRFSRNFGAQRRS